MKTLLLAVLCITLSSVADARESSLNDGPRIQEALEAARLAKSPEYRELKAQVELLRSENKVLREQAEELKSVIEAQENILARVCEATDVRRMERLQFDPIANRYPVKTKCNEIDQYVADPKVLAAKQTIVARQAELYEKEQRRQANDLSAQALRAAIANLGQILTNEEWTQIVKENTF